MIINRYPKHLSENVRIKIAVQYVNHELRKLFPSIKEKKIWNLIDSNTNKWFKTNPTLAPVRDFWNGVHGISTGFKLKQIVPWLTSKNVNWQIKKVSISDLHFGTNFEELKRFPYRPSAQEVKQWFLDDKNKKIYLKALKDHDTRTSQNFERDTGLPIVIQNEKKVMVIDGNRRLLKAILNKKTTIKIALGTFTGDPEKKDHWVSTPLLQDLVRIHRKLKNTKSISEIIINLIKDSSPGRYELKDRVLQLSDKSDLKLYKSIKNKLKI